MKRYGHYLMNVFQCVLQIETPRSCLLLSNTYLSRERMQKRGMMLKLITVYKRKLINLYGKINSRQLIIQNYKDQTRGSKRWWSVVNGITGRSNSEVPISSLLDPQVINKYFQSINTDSNYTDPVPLLFLRVPGFQKYLSIVL